MAANESLTPLGTLSNQSVDPNVRIPDSVKAAGSAADALHAASYPREEAPTPAPAKEALPQPPAPEPLHTPQPQLHQGELAPQAPAPQPEPAPDDKNVTADEWRHRFLSMQGRYQSQVRNNASMEEQMRQLGEELIRTQNMLSTSQGAAPAPGQAQSDIHHENLITDADRENYGDELIDLTRRAAREAISPELARLREDNQKLSQRVQNTGRRETFAAMDQSLPAWRQINNDNRFKAWVRLPNIYTGELRVKMLNDAINGANAPKAIALFRDFIAEANATGQQAPAAPTEQQAPAAPRTPALDLETLAAPGRARPASGDTQVPTEKPSFTRAQISKFYDDSRKGLYAGREPEYRQIEADMQSAQREGRIR